MIVAGRLLLEDSARPGACRLAPGFVRIADGAIAEVVEGEIPASSDLGGPTALVAPGFVDTHVHPAQFDMIGAHGRPLLDWLTEVTFPSEARWADPDYAEAMCERVAGELFSHGTTSVCAYATVHHAATSRAIAAFTRRGLRGVVGQSLSDRFAPRELVGEASALLDQTADLLDRYPPGSPVAAAVTPRFAVSCTEGLLAGAGRLAADRDGALIQTHLSETPDECDLVSRLFGGRSYPEVYRDAGLATPRTLFGHGVWLDDADRRLLAERGAVVAHCPTANSFLRSGAMDLARLREAGVRVALGSDVGAGYERSMVRVARAAIETAAALGDRFPSAAQAWWWITAGAADAAGFAAGRLRVGAIADVVVARPDTPWLAGPCDPLATLLFGWDDRWLKRTLAGGRVAYRTD